MSYTTTFQIEKPDYKTLRFDVPINSNFDKIDAGLKNWPSGTQPGDAGNYDEIVLTEGVLWRDTTNHKLKIRGASAWEIVWTDTGVQTLKNVSAPGSAADDSFYHYANDVSSVACPHWKLQSGDIIKLCKNAHVADINATVIGTLVNSYGTADLTLEDIADLTLADIDATVITALTNAYGTADGTLEDIGATNSSDVSGAIKNNFQECTTEIAHLKTVVDDIRTKLNGQTDQSGYIENNFKECTTEIANLKTVVDDIRTKFNTVLSNLETLGVHATS